MEQQNLELVQEENQEEINVEKATQIFGAIDNINAIKKMREGMKQQRIDMVGDENIAAKLSSMVANLEPQQIRELSDEAVNEIYKDENGEIEFAVKMDKTRTAEFKRDFLVFLRESDIADETFEKELVILEEAIKENNEELQMLLKDFGDLSAFMRTKLQKEFEAANGDRKEKLTKIIEAFDDAYTLNRVYDHYKEFGTRNTISDSHHRALDVYNRYMKVISKINFKTDLTSFNNLEKNFLEEKYHAESNLFLFAVIKMIGYKKDASADIEGVFLSQLAVNVKALYTDSFASEEKKEQFKASIRRVLDLFLGE